MTLTDEQLQENRDAEAKLVRFEILKLFGQLGGLKRLLWTELSLAREYLTEREFDSIMTTIYEPEARRNQ